MKTTSKKFRSMIRSRVKSYLIHEGFLDDMDSELESLNKQDQETKDKQAEVEKVKGIIKRSFAEFMNMPQVKNLVAKGQTIEGIASKYFVKMLMELDSFKVEDGDPTVAQEKIAAALLGPGKSLDDTAAVEVAVAALVGDPEVDEESKKIAAAKEQEAKQQQYDALKKEEEAAAAEEAAAKLGLKSVADELAKIKSEISAKVRELDRYSTKTEGEYVYQGEWAPAQWMTVTRYYRDGNPLGKEEPKEIQKLENDINSLSEKEKRIVSKNKELEAAVAVAVAKLGSSRSKRSQFGKANKFEGSRRRTGGVVLVERWQRLAGLLK
jgi:hypothetical protein